VLIFKLSWTHTDISTSIQPPGMPHAVVTVEDSMVAGRFFYTAAHFGRSIKCIREGFQRRLHDNENISEKQYNYLITIFDNIHRADLALFTPVQIEGVYVEVIDLLEQQNRITFDVDKAQWVVVGGQTASTKKGKRPDPKKKVPPKKQSQKQGPQKKPAAKKKLQQLDAVAEAREKFVSKCVQFWQEEMSSRKDSEPTETSSENPDSLLPMGSESEGEVAVEENDESGDDDGQYVGQ